MSRPHAVTATDIFLRLLLDEMEAQGEVLRRILDRLPEPTVAGQPGPGVEGKPSRVSEPAPARRRTPEDGEDGPAPVTEPAPPAIPAETRPVDEPAPQRLPDGDSSDDGTSVPPPPPRAGRGSGLEAWRSFARLAKVRVPPEAGRDEIIATCVKARVIPAD